MCACAECQDRACSSSGCSFSTDRAHLSLATRVSPAEVCSFCLLGAASAVSVCVVAVVFASLSAAGIVLDPPPSLSLAPHPHPLVPRPCPPLPTSKTWGKLESASQGLPHFLSLHASGRRPRACCLVQVMSKSLKKLVEESREKNQPEVDMSDRGISNMLDISDAMWIPEGLPLERNWVISLTSNCWWQCETFRWFPPQLMLVKRRII